MTGRVTTEGDDIYYEVRGRGQPLLLIPGGGGDAGFYTFVADQLCDEFKVIGYDRRGNSRSTRHVPQHFDVSQQSRDAVAVLHAAKEASAFIFGNSAGAVIALDMAATQPRAVRAVVAHEPPVARGLPDGDRWLRACAGLHQLSLTFGHGLAMLSLSLYLGLHLRAYRAAPTDFGLRLSQNQNHDFFLKHELLPVTSYMPEVARIGQNGVRLVMAAGQWTLDHGKFFGRTAPILAGLLGCEMVVFPGHPLSYFDMPREWTATLRGVLHKIENRSLPLR